MSAFDKRMKQIRNGSTGNRILDALQVVIPAVLLTADDIWCVTKEQAEMLVKGSLRTRRRLSRKSFVVDAEKVRQSKQTIARIVAQI